MILRLMVMNIEAASTLYLVRPFGKAWTCWYIVSPLITVDDGPMERGQDDLQESGSISCGTPSM